MNRREALLSQLPFAQLCSLTAAFVSEPLTQTHPRVSYPDHLDLNSMLEKGPDLGRYFQPGLPHHSQPLQLFECAVCLETVEELREHKRVLLPAVGTYTTIKNVTCFTSKAHGNISQINKICVETLHVQYIYVFVQYLGPQIVAQVLPINNYIPFPHDTL